MRKLLLYILIACVTYSCTGDKNETTLINVNKMKEELILANKYAAEQESNQIDAYIKRRGLEVVKTNTGLRYKIYKDQPGDNIKQHELALVKYSVSLLDGTLCYTTSEKVEEFIVGKDYVESGLHEGILNMSEGDKAHIIIPSHLAHGLTGDLKKIPLRSTIVYDIELVNIKK